MTVFVDASDSGWGVVLCFNGETRIFGGSWSGPERAMSINVRELSSARIAIRLAASQKTDDVHMVMHFNIDNTSAQSWLQKQRAPVFVANAIVADVAAIAGHHNITIASIRHVASAWNPADAPSRARQPPVRTFREGTVEGNARGLGTRAPDPVRQ
mgnify:CR=1 FL=1